ncbi:hypothetical protein HYH02_011494 [Chlamydomonas schloesseri]|uniref:AB hydrolase-1 domain-containing protein n=1 Tax=Chlamydomonas schloesseri TaxID=2026947 RepID=A0A835W0Z3_9CHLO|nr:hypothetical protein HYH02_011494 [Chlamydomonas schloesseri]|eukprot:KAG2436557.1 hypothetical protein HYH02_011494 [Chlamydomonas schloesseri]
MQKWTLDATSLVSFALVVAATVSLPAPVHVALLFSELAFAATAFSRYRAFNSAARNGAGSAVGWVSYLATRLLPTAYASALSNSATASSSVDDDESACGGEQAEAAAAKLFDESEGHLGLLEGGHLITQWFAGLAGPHQLKPSHVTQLLSYLLLLPSSSSPSAADASVAAAAAAAPAGGAPAQCPRVRAWSSRLMDILNLEYSSSSDASHANNDNSNSNLPSAAATNEAQQQHAAEAAATAAAAEKEEEQARLLACSAEPLTASYRPLLFYLMMEAVAAATHVALRLMGFRAAATPNNCAQVYVWTPPAAAAAEPAATAEESEPLVFLHGIGLGLTPYVRMLGRLVAGAAGRRTVYAVQYKHVSMRLTTRIPAPHEVAADVGTFLMREGVTRMSVLAHSYGTLVASALNKAAAANPAAAPTISRLTLVDPVCFAMFLPHLVRNAIYQQPVAAAATAAEAATGAAAAAGPSSTAAPAAAGAATSVGGGLLRQLLKGLVVAEFHCSVALRRRLDWTTVNLWPSELPANSTVVLSGRDNLVPVNEVRQILANRAKLVAAADASASLPAVLHHAHIGHGGFLVDAEVQSGVLAAALGVPVATYAERVAAATAAAAAAAASADAAGLKGSSEAAAAEPAVAAAEAAAAEAAATAMAPPNPIEMFIAAAHSFAANANLLAAATASNETATPKTEAATAAAAAAVQHVAAAPARGPPPCRRQLLSRLQQQHGSTQTLPAGCNDRGPAPGLPMGFPSPELQQLVPCFAYASVASIAGCSGSSSGSARQQQQKQLITHRLPTPATHLWIMEEGRRASLHHTSPYGGHSYSHQHHRQHQAAATAAATTASLSRCSNSALLGTAVRRKLLASAVGSAANNVASAVVSVAARRGGAVLSTRVWY